MANLTLNTASETAIDLEHLAESALRADMAAKEATDKADELKTQFKEALAKTGKLNGDTKAVGNARTVISPNRRFSQKLAKELLTEDEIAKYSKTVIDPDLVKANVSPDVFALMQDDNGWKLGLKVND